MEKGRSFLVIKNMESMISMNDYETRTERVSVEELKEIPNLYCSINNGALLGSLRKLGIKWERTDVVSAVKGDTIYSVKVEGISQKLYKYSDLPELPGYCSLVISRCRIF